MSSPEPFVRLAVLSDLHAYATAPKGSEPSFLPATEEHQLAQHNPFEGLVELISQNNLTADYLLCPGDIGDKADPKGIAHAWHHLQRVAKQLGDATYVASTGNHDMDSRSIFHNYDPTDVLKKLAPPYPVSDQSEVDRYWSRYYCITDHTNCRIVSINSSAFHWLDTERNHGRVSRSTLEWLREDLAKREPRQINILLCHHHPHLHSELAKIDTSYEVMRDGDRLIDLLGEGNLGQWLIVHGHKHFPNISYAAGLTESPIVFSCGSFSARLYMELGTRARNQFYIIEIPLNKVKELGLVGNIYAWDWSDGKGWIKPGGSSGLTSLTPFGSRENPHSLATRLSDFLGTKSYATWLEVVTEIPSMEFLSPADLRALERILKKNYKLSINWTENQPSELGRML